MGNLRKSKGEIKPSASSTSPSTVCEGRIFKVMNVLSSLSKCQEKYYGGKMPFSRFTVGNNMACHIAFSLRFAFNLFQSAPWQ